MVRGRFSFPFDFRYDVSRFFMVMNHTIMRPVIMTIPFVACYFILRSLPVEPCDFLHEATYNDEGKLDYCGSGDSGFVDLTVRKWPIKMDFRPLDELQIDKPCRFEIHLKQFDGSPLSANDVALSHTQKIHLLAIDSSLSDYQHLHPTHDSLYNGVWHFTLTPKRGGKYSVFLDFIPVRSPRRVLLSASFDVDGDIPKPNSYPESLKVVRQDQLFEIQLVREDEKSDLQLILTGKSSDGNSLELRPVMGAFAHMVAFDSKIKGFAHLHPKENISIESSADSHNGKLTFVFSPPASGHYRLWAQLKVTGQENEIYIPFDININT